MRSNKKDGSTYVPVYGYYVQSSKVFRTISRGTATSGSSTFLCKGTTREKDLYYAIHKYNCRKANSSTLVVKISDLYDYSKSNEYTGVAGVAINTMYKAQEAGYLTKYYVKVMKD